MRRRRNTDAFVRRPRHLVAWALGAMASVLFAPLLTYALAPGPWRSAAIEVSVGLGFAAMALLCLQFATSGRFLWLARPIGQHAMMRLHRLVGVLAGVLVLAHAAGVILSNPGYLAFLDPRVNLPRALALGAVTLALLAIVVLSLARREVGVSYEIWRLLHGGLAAMIVVVGAAHIFMVGHHAGPPWQRGLWIAFAGLALALLVWSRGVRPWQQRRRPWRVVEVRPEHVRTCTLVLMPEGHAGMPFETGQHVWLTVGDSSFSLQQHPFTIASSDARPDRIELTIKALGDFTASVPSIPVGTRAFLEGPYGARWLTGSADTPLVMIGGGIGITPFASALRSMRDRGIHRRFVLFHGAADLARATFNAELRQLTMDLGGDLVTVLESAPDEATPDKDIVEGRIDRRLLADRLDPTLLGQARFVLCGPPQMLRQTKTALHELGVPRWHIHVEDIAMV